jgi:hypothetical protein
MTNPISKLKGPYFSFLLAEPNEIWNVEEKCGESLESSRNIIIILTQLQRHAEDLLCNPQRLDALELQGDSRTYPGKSINTRMDSARRSKASEPAKSDPSKPDRRSAIIS